LQITTLKIKKIKNVETFDFDWLFFFIISIN